MYTYNLPLSILINNRALKPSEFKMNAILDFARFLSSGCFVGDLGLILDGFAVVVCVLGCFVWGFMRVGGGLSGGVLSGGFCPGGFCPGGFVRGGFVRGGFVRGGFVRGGFVRGGFVRGVLSGGVLSRGVLSTGGFCPAGGFVQRGIVRGVLSGGFCPRIYACVLVLCVCSSLCTK